MSLALRKAGIKDGERDKVARFCEADFSKSPSLTSQSFADEVDINKIMKRIEKGQTVLTSSGEPFYGDVSDFGGLQEAIMKVQEADELFMQFPAEIRSKFENDPVKFVEFMEDSSNYEEGLKLGLFKPRTGDPIPPVPDPGVSTPPAGGSTQLTS